MAAALGPLGEYVGSIGMDRPLADYSREEVLTLIEVVVTAFQDHLIQAETSVRLMLDFNHRASFGELVTHLVDAASRPSTGPRRLATTWAAPARVPCDRALQFEYAQAPKDEGAEFEGRTLRIFAPVTSRGPRRPVAPVGRPRSLHPQGQPAGR